MSKKIITFVILKTLLFTLASKAESFSIFTKEVEGSVELNFDAIRSCQKIYKHAEWTYIPTKMKTAESSDDVAKAIMNHNLKSLLNKSFDDGLKKQVTAVSEGVRSDYSPLEGHKVSFRLEAILARTEMSYKGVVDAKVSLRLDSGTLNLEVSKQIYHQAQLVFTHTDQSSLQTDLVAFRYSF